MTKETGDPAHEAFEKAYLRMRSHCTGLTHEAHDPRVKALAETLGEVADAELQHRSFQLRELEERVLENARKLIAESEDKVRKLIAESERRMKVVIEDELRDMFEEYIGRRDAPGSGNGSED